MSMMRPLVAAVCAVVALAITAPPTFAASFYPTQDCVAAKLKAAAKKCQAGLKAWSKWDKGGGTDNTTRDAAIAKATSKLSAGFTKADTKSAGKDVDCSQTSLTGAEINPLIDSDVSDIVSAINGGLTLGTATDAMCGSKLVKTAATACSAYLKAQSKYFKKFGADPSGVARGLALAKASSKFTAKFDAAATGCPTTSTSSAINTKLAQGALGSSGNDGVIMNTTTSPDLSTSWTQVTPAFGTPYLGGVLHPICSHSTPYSYFYKRGSGADANKLLVYYQGGGACWDSLTCSQPVYDMDVTAGDNPANTTTGFGDLTNVNNPFRNWSAVFIAYCTGDVHWGDSNVDIQHKGWQNAKVVEKFAREHFVNPSEVFVTGSSAGAYGAVLHGIYLHEVFLASTFNVIGDAGSGVITNAFLTQNLEPAWHVQQHLPTYIGLNGSITQLTIADLYSTGANYYATAGTHHFAPRGSRFGQYSTAYDGGGGSQTFFYNVMVNGILDNGSWWHSSCDWNRQALIYAADAQTAAPSNYRSYFGPGSRHTIWGSNRVYTEVHGPVQTFVDWLNDMRTSVTWNSVACTDCSLLGTCTAGTNSGASCQHDSECPLSVCNLTDAKPGFKCNPASVNSGATCQRDSDCIGVGAACNVEASFGVCKNTSTVNPNKLCSTDADCDGTSGVCVTEQPFQLDGVVSCPP